MNICLKSVPSLRMSIYGFGSQCFGDRYRSYNLFSRIFYGDFNKNPNNKGYSLNWTRRDFVSVCF